MSEIIFYVFRLLGSFLKHSREERCPPPNFKFLKYCHFKFEFYKKSIGVYNALSDCDIVFYLYVS